MTFKELLAGMNRADPSWSHLQRGEIADMTEEQCRQHTVGYSLQWVVCSECLGDLNVSYIPGAFRCIPCDRLVRP